MIALLFALLALQPLSEPPVTTFSQHCYEVHSDAVTVYFGYTSNAERHYMGSGYDFITAVGEYPDAFTVYAGEMPAPELPYVAFTELVSTGDSALDAVTGGVGETVTIAFDWLTLPVCGQPPIETPAPTPTDEPCSAIAIDAGTGLPYCYAPTDNGLVPLPPAPEYQT